MKFIKEVFLDDVSKKRTIDIINQVGHFLDVGISEKPKYLEREIYKLAGSYPRLENWIRLGIPKKWFGVIQNCGVSLEDIEASLEHTFLDVCYRSRNSENCKYDRTGYRIVPNKDFTLGCFYKGVKLCNRETVLEAKNYCRMHNKRIQLNEESR